MQLLRQKSFANNKGYQIYHNYPGRIKQIYIEKYQGKNLEDIIDGNVINTVKGTCYHIESKEKISSIDIGDTRTLILDIETMGFSSVPIILVGLARIKDNNILIDQYLSRNMMEEPAILMALVRCLRKNDTIITFNGRRFDIPFIEERFSFHRIKESLYTKIHHDALPLSRYAWKKKLPNCKLATLEKYILGLDRKDDIPSRSVPNFYNTYIRQKNVGPLIPIINHNKQDLITLAMIFSKLRDPDRN